MALVIDPQLTKSVRTFEHDRQYRRKRSDRRKKQSSFCCLHCHPEKSNAYGNRGTLRGGQERLCNQRVTLMKRETPEAMALLYHNDHQIADQDWVADIPVRPHINQVNLSAIIFSIAKPQRQRRRGAAKDFVMVPSVINCVQCLDDDTLSDFDTFESDNDDEWEVLSGPSVSRSYASAARP